MSNLIPSELTRDLPLAKEVIDYSGLKIQPMPETAMFMIQKSVSFNAADLDVSTIPNVFSKINTALPNIGKCRDIDDILLLSLTPISWMALSNLDQAQMAAQIINKNNQELGMVLTDMSDQYIKINITGKHSRNLLAKGCELDLSPDNFIPYSCTRTLLAHLNIVIWREESENLSLLVDISYAEHLWAWLKGAALEYSEL